MKGIEKKLQLLGKQILSKSEIGYFLQSIPNAPSLYNLTRSGLLKVIKKDARYLNTQIDAVVNPFVLGAAYCDFQGYIFGGLAIYNRYGFTEQIANQYLIYSPTLYGTRKILGSSYTFKKVKTKLLYGVTQKMIQGTVIRLMSPERSFIEFCRENPDKLALLQEIYTSKLDKQLFEKILARYPYQSVRDFITHTVLHASG